MTTETKRLTCEWCDAAFDFDSAQYCEPEDQKLCGECEDRCVWCSICEEWNVEDDTCRHLFRDDSYHWNGSGAGGSPDRVKESFVKLISLMPIGFAEALRAAIIRDEFSTFLSAPMVGSGGHMTLHGVVDPPGCLWNYYGKAMVQISPAEQPTACCSNCYSENVEAVRLRLLYQNWGPQNGGIKELAERALVAVNNGGMLLDQDRLEKFVEAQS